jgi:MFS family permease
MNMTTVAPRAAFKAAAGAASAEHRGHRTHFIGLSYTLGVLILGTNLPTPLYRVYGHEFGFSPLTLTLIFATYAAVLIPSLLLCGPLGDVVGHRRVLLPAMLVAAAGTGLFAAASSTGWLFVARATQGLAVGAASGALTAALVAAAPGGNTRRASLLASAMTVGGGGAGPLLAGILAQYAPMPRVLVYLVELVLLVPAIALVATLPRTMGRPSHNQETHRRPRMPHVPTRYPPSLRPRGRHHVPLLGGGGAVPLPDPELRE